MPHPPSGPSWAPQRRGIRTQTGVEAGGKPPAGPPTPPPTRGTPQSCIHAPHTRTKQGYQGWGRGWVGGHVPQWLPPYHTRTPTSPTPFTKPNFTQKGLTTLLKTLKKWAKTPITPTRKGRVSQGWPNPKRACPKIPSHHLTQPWLPPFPPQNSPLCTNLTPNPKENARIQAPKGIKGI